MTEDAAFGDRGKVSLEDVEIGSSDGGSGDANNGVKRVLNGGPGMQFPRWLARAVVNQGVHQFRVGTERRNLQF